EQHLGDPGRRSEIAVDLEGRVSVQQIGVHAAPGGSAPPEVDRRQELLQAFVRLFAIEQTRPKVHLPGQAPARPFVGAELQRLAARRPKGRIRTPGDLPARMQAVEMGDVPVAGLRLLEVLPPYLKLSVSADLKRNKALPGVFQLLSKISVDAQSLRRLDAVGKEIPYQAHVHSRRRAHRRS